MSLQEVQAQVTSGDRKEQIFSVKMDLPDTLDESRQRYGDEVVFSRFMASLIIDAQSAMRTEIRKDSATVESVQTKMSEWSPKLKARGKTVAEKVQSLLAGLTEEERAAVLAEYL